MSHENVEIVRKVYEASARRDAAAVLSFYDPEVEWDITSSPAKDLMGHNVYRGHEGLRTFFREWYEAWEEVSADYEELVDAGDNVIAMETTRGRGRLSGAPVELPHFSVWTLRDGRIVRVSWFGSWEEATQAAGLSN